MAGLVAGDSDSSALTQDSGDEGVPPPTPRESVVTGTDAGTEVAEDEDVEMSEQSPGMSLNHSHGIRSDLLRFVRTGTGTKGCEKPKI